MMSRVGRRGGGAALIGAVVAACSADSVGLQREVILTVSGQGEGRGRVCLGPGPVGCQSLGADPQQWTLYSEQTVELTAQPDEYSIFIEWGADCAGSGPCTLVTNRAHAVTVLFDLKLPRLIVRAQDGGRVRSTDGKIECGVSTTSTTSPRCAASFSPGTNVTLAAEPDPGWHFVGWGDTCAGTAPGCLVTMDRTRRVSAVFATNQCADLPETCDGRDENCNGLVDEGLVYEELFDVLDNVSTAPRNGNEVLGAVSFGAAGMVFFRRGVGNSADELRALLLGPDGHRTAEPLVFSDRNLMPVDIRPPVWLEDRFLVVATQREASPAKVVLLGVRPPGEIALAPTPLFTSSDLIGAAFVLDGELVVPSTSATGEVRVRSFTADGQPGRFSGELAFTVPPRSPGQPMLYLRAVATPGEVLWLYTQIDGRQNFDGVALFRTDHQLNALVPEAVRLTEPGTYFGDYAPGALVLPGPAGSATDRLFVAYDAPSTAASGVVDAYVGSWSLEGAPRDGPLLVEPDSAVGYVVGDPAAHQLHVITRHNGFYSHARVSLGLALTQPAHGLLGANGAAGLLLPGGLVVAGDDYLGHYVAWTLVGCRGRP